MDEMISRQAAIDEINKYILSFDAMDANFLDGLRTAIKIIKENFPSAQQWTPCSERPPEEEGVYFVTFNKSCLLENELPVMDAIWRDGQWQYGVLESYEHRMPKLIIEPIEELKVIAWMPLPEPYKGE